MDLTYNTVTRARPSISPADLPRIWPLAKPRDIAIEEKQLFKEHLKACDAGDLQHIQAELIRCRKRNDYFVMTHCKTKDEHDAITPVKRFPRKAYIARLLQVAAVEKKLAIPKSRQIMVSWTFVCHFLHMATFFSHRLIFFQSKKDDDAAAMIDRAKHVYENLPWWLKEAAPLKRPLHKLPYNKIMFANGSLIWGIPQGQDVVRQHTASGILGDEFAFQNQAEEAWTAMKPTVDGGGQVILVSTANGKNFFYQVCFDKLDDANKSF